MSDNPRPALYGVRYAPRLIGRPTTAPPRLVTVVGRPPVVAVSHGTARVLVRRESLDDMNRRDIGL